MSPAELASAVYKQENCSRSFSEDLEAHLLRGFVFSRPDFFVMGRPVFSKAPQVEIVDPWKHFSSSQADCWHVYLFAGNMGRALEMMPWELPFLSFERGNQLQVVSFRRIKSLIQSGRYNMRG